MITISMTGIAKNQRMLKGLVNPEDVKQALIRTGLMIEERAKILAPVDTGRLRASISTNWNDSGMSHADVESPAKSGDGVSQPIKGDAIAVVRVGTAVSYAIYQELGTRKMAAQPFLIPAAQHGISSFQKEIDKMIEINKRK